MANVQQPNRLLDLFRDQPLSEHGDRWDGLWKDSFTPWDRAGPSLALLDLLVDRPDLVPPVLPGTTPAKKALVPGCGRGYDALLLASLGYDVWGVDYSAEATHEAVEYEKVAADGDERYAAKREGVEKGKVTWLTGDFFADDWIRQTGVDKFDLIFDYTFFCALPVTGRPAWAKRMNQLLAPDDGSRLICLQWPSGKAWSTGGPPWGVRPEHYVAQLARPGVTVGYDAEGSVPAEELVEVGDGGLKRLELIVPKRTHKAGCLDDGTVHDRVSVFRRL